jgi:hypothetical protein
MKIPTVLIPTYVPITMYLKKIHEVIIPSSLLLGGFFMISGSAGLNDNAVAGNPSVTRLTHNN